MVTKMTTMQGNQSSSLVVTRRSSSAGGPVAKHVKDKFPEMQVWRFCIGAQNLYILWLNFCFY